MVGRHGGYCRQVPKPFYVGVGVSRVQTWKYNFLPAVGEWEKFRKRRIIRSEDMFRILNNFAWGSSCSRWMERTAYLRAGTDLFCSWNLFSFLDTNRHADFAKGACWTLSGKWFWYLLMEFTHVNQVVFSVSSPWIQAFCCCIWVWGNLNLSV